MDVNGLQCHGCGSTNVFFDAKRRIITCNTCGKEEYYSRATLNATGKVSVNRDNAMKLFMQGQFESAQHYALEVLNMVIDSATALFIMAYYDEVVCHRMGRLKEFFVQVKDVPLEYDEVKELRQLFTAAAYALQDFEEQIVELIAVNMQSGEDAKELAEFIDQICPYFIAKRPSIDFFTANLADMYREIAGHCDIPKTCFALLKLIETNPDSPYPNNSFYLSAKTRYFYDHFIIPLGDIINAMRMSEYKEKFRASYQKRRQKYEADAQIH